HQPGAEKGLRRAGNEERQRHLVRPNAVRLERPNFAGDEQVTLVQVIALIQRGWQLMDINQRLADKEHQAGGKDNVRSEAVLQNSRDQ
ncbi:MAG: hypothetical protein GX577_15870, partial [Leptolinea sp.]|nr:hypothetical protein [Leptolinea sp.]